MTDAAAWQMWSPSAQAVACYGLAVVQAALEARGVGWCEWDAARKGPVAVSLYWPEQLYDFVRWRYDDANRGRRMLVGGNYASTSPQALLPFDVACYLGDGELWDGAPEGEWIVSGDDPGPKPLAVAPVVLPVLYEDVQQSRRAFAEISRGCKWRCAFCQYGWLKPYREVDLADIYEVLTRAATKSVRLFAGDRFSHSRLGDIQTMVRGLGKNDTSSDATVKQVVRHPELLDSVRRVRTGVEGMSERLRRLVGKPNSTERLRDWLRLLVAHGFHTADVYMIYHLPTETADDIAEFAEWLGWYRGEVDESFCLAFHWNAFSPSARTPFQWAAPSQGPYPELSAVLEGGREAGRGRVTHRPGVSSRWTLVKRMLAIRATEEVADLVFSVATAPARWRARPDRVEEEYRSATGRELLAAWPLDVPLPWDRHVVYEKDRMARMYEKRVLGRAA